LVFGALLKTWACLVSASLFAAGRLPAGQFLAFGVGNLAVGLLFWLYSAVEAA